MSTKMKFVGMDLCPTTCSARAVVPLTEFFNFAPTIESIVSSSSPYRYDDFGEQLDDVSRTMPEDLDELYGSMSIDPVQEFEPIVRTNFIVKEKDAFKENVHRELNGPIIVALNSYRPYLALKDRVKILVLCAGNQEDACRLAYHGLLSNASVDFVGASAPHARARVSLAQATYGHRATSKYLRDVPRDWFDGPYDLILAHHGIHHLLRTKKDVECFASLIPVLLADGGIFLGDRISQTGVRTLEAPTYCPGLHVEFLGTEVDSNSIEGVMRVRVGRSVFQDPILSDQRLESVVARMGMMYSVFEGQGVYTGINNRGDSLVAPTKWKKGVVRGDGKVMSLIQLWHGRPIGYPPLDILEPGKWELRDRIPHKDAGFLDFPINRGVLLGVQDSAYVADDSVMYSQKSDGVACRVVFTEGSAWMVTDHKPQKIYFYGSLTRTGQGCVRLQCEWIPDGDSFSICLNEVVSFPGSHGVGFARRWSWWHQFSSRYPVVNSLISTKAQTYSWDEAYRAAKDGGWEGIVLNWANARSPMDGDLYSRSARYLKFVRTVDVLDRKTGKVCEVTLQGKLIRERPDKSVGNNEQAIKEVLKGCDLEDWNFLSPVGYDSGDVLGALEQVCTDSLGLTQGLFSALSSPSSPVAHGIIRLLKFPFQSLPCPPKDSPYYEALRSRFYEEVLRDVAVRPPGVGIAYESVLAGDYDFVAGAWYGFLATPVDSARQVYSSDEAQDILLP